MIGFGLFLLVSVTNLSASSVRQEPLFLQLVVLLDFWFCVSFPVPFFVSLLCFEDEMSKEVFYLPLFP